MLQIRVVDSLSILPAIRTAIDPGIGIDIGTFVEIYKALKPSWTRLDDEHRALYHPNVKVCVLEVVTSRGGPWGGTCFISISARSRARDTLEYVRSLKVKES